MEKRMIAERFGTKFAIELEALCKKYQITVSELEDFMYDHLQTVFVEQDCAFWLEDNDCPEDGDVKFIQKLARWYEKSEDSTLDRWTNIKNAYNFIKEVK